MRKRIYALSILLVAVLLVGLLIGLLVSRPGVLQGTSTALVETFTAVALLRTTNAPTITPALEPTATLEPTVDLQRMVQAVVAGTVTAGAQFTRAAQFTQVAGLTRTATLFTKTPSNTPTPTRTTTATRTPSAGLPSMPQGLPRARIVKVVDGDTADVSLNGQTVRVRLIGINTPETVDPRSPVECFGKEASNKAHSLLDGQTVYLEADSSQGDKDTYGRSLRYFWLADGRSFNYEMIAQGYAYEYTYRLPYKYQKQFRAAQQNARDRQLGLWSPQTCNGKP